MGSEGDLVMEVPGWGQVNSQNIPSETIYEMVRARAQEDPEAVFLSSHGRKGLTNRDLFDQVGTVVHGLRALGVTPNARIALVLPNGPEMAAAFISIAAGAACAPLNPSYRASEFEFYLSDLNAKSLVVWSECDSPAREIARKLNIPIFDLKPTLSAGAGSFELIGVNGVTSSSTVFSQSKDIALVLHTSGTTSRPKIVPLSHRNLCASARNIMPLFHIHGLIGAVLSSLKAGGGVFCTPGLEVEKVFEWIDEYHPTWYTAVPTMHQGILSRASFHRDVVLRNPLRFIRSSSAALPEKVFNQLEEVFNAPVVESYGMTEAAHQMTSNPLSSLPRKVGSVGLAGGPEVEIMDEDGKLLKPGQVGEVVIRGENVTSGYENNVSANQSAFMNGWFRTGDQGRLDEDGYLFLTGRLKEMINRGGEKIAPKEVDEVILLHPGVAQAVAFAIPHPTLGEDVAAAIVLKEGAATTEAEVRDFASSRLVDFKVPSQILIVDEIPKGPTGKLQRIGLADRLNQLLQSKRDSNFLAPTNSYEQQIVDIWTKLLNAKRVGTRDSFYALGGDSLLTVVMMNEVETRLQTKVSLESFLKSPTIEALASSIMKRGANNVSTSAAVDHEKIARPIRDSLWSGMRNRLFQLIALYAPGYTTTRVWLHRLRGVAIGENVSIGLSVIIETAYPRLVSIGKNVTIGMRVVVIGHLRDLTSEARAGNEPTVCIEDDVYIGPGVIILPNVIIGKGAVVSAGSVVSRSVPPHTLARGNPAEPVARCGVSLGGGVSYEEFIRNLKPMTQNDDKVGGLTS
jgi:acyl-CoA synthetase (AMP-forming)/AMP-acid ligase II/acetyltransferase-like isoleucine patch superfamily enzyme/acyl carrier protein